MTKNKPLIKKLIRIQVEAGVFVGLGFTCWLLRSGGWEVIGPWLGILGFASVTWRLYRIGYHQGYKQVGQVVLSGSFDTPDDDSEVFCSCIQPVTFTDPEGTSWCSLCSKLATNVLRRG